MKFYLAFLSFTLMAVASPFGFEENRGQTESKVRYFVPQRASTILIESDHLRFAGAGRELALRFPGGKLVQWEATEPQAGTRTYRLAQGGTIEDVRRFGRLTAKEIYPGIDLTLYFAGTHLEYDFVVRPQADARQIRIEFAGAANLRAREDGSFTWEDGTLRLYQRAPVVRQGGATIDSHWEPAGNGVFQLQLGAYEKSKPLVVDPVVEVSTYLGGEEEEEIVAMGDGWVAGHTSSVYFPGSTGPRQGRDIFLRFVPTANLQQALPPLLHRTYIFGGLGDDTLATAIMSTTLNSFRVDLIGTTSSRDLPMWTPQGNSFQGGVSDAFAVRWTVTVGTAQMPGTQHAAGIYYGGTGEDRAAWGYSTGWGWLFAGTTDSTDLPVAHAIQPQLAGGRDIFLAHVLIDTPSEPQFATYLGGEGDEYLHRLVFGQNENYLVGETRSQNFPLLQGELQGESDAFLLELSGFLFSPNTLPKVPEFRRALRLGGNGADRLISISFTPKNLIVAGETTSSDLAALNASQAEPGGGRDAFYALISRETLEPVRLSYYGGSGEERVRDLIPSPGKLFVIVGETTSENLPLREPLQDSLKGSSDGFLAVFNETSPELEVASYWGGSGEDTISVGWLPVASQSHIRIAGSTTSADFPLVNPVTMGRGEGRDAFYAHLGLPVFSAPDLVWAARGATSRLSVFALTPLGSTPVTARVEDPSLAQIRLGGARYSEITVPGVELNSNFPPIFAVEGLASNGETVVVISAPGFAERRVRVRLGEAVVTLQGLAAELPIFAGPQQLRAILQILDPESGILMGEVAPIDVNLTLLKWTSTNSAAARIESPIAGQPFLTPRGFGETVLSAEGPYTIHPSGGLKIQILPARFEAFPLEALANPLFASPVEIRLLGVPFGNRTQISGAFQITSEDPDRLEVSLGGPFAGSVTINTFDSWLSSLRFQVRGKASTGAVNLRVSSPALSEDMVIPVQLRKIRLTPAIVTTNWKGAQSAHIGRGTPMALQANLQWDVEDGRTGGMGPFQSPVVLQVVSSNPAVIASTESPWNVTGSQNGLQLPTIGEGETELSLRTDSPHATVSGTVRVTSGGAVPRTWLPASIRVGRNLVALVELREQDGFLPAAEAEVSVDDPTLALIAASANGEAVASARVAGPNALRLWVHGIAAAGTTNLRIRMPGWQEGTIPLQLTPAGFAFTQDAAAFPLNAMQPTITVSTYALDPVTLAPLESQSLRGGIPVSLQVRSDSGQLSLVRPECRYTSSSLVATDGVSCRFTMNFAAPGAYVLSLSPVEGFTWPAVRADMRVLVDRLALDNPSRYGVQDALTQWQFNVVRPLGSTQFAAQVPFTLRSLDPALLLFSRSAQDPGEATLTLSSGNAVFAHALAGEGVARYRVEGDGIVAAEQAALLSPLRISWQLSGTPTPPAPVMKTGTESRETVYLVSADLRRTVGLQRGKAERVFTVRSSDETVVSVSGDFRFTEGKNEVAVLLNARAPGQARIVLEAAGQPSEEFRVVVE